MAKTNEQPVPILPPEVIEKRRIKHMKGIVNQVSFTKQTVNLIIEKMNDTNEPFYDHIIDVLESLDTKLEPIVNELKIRYQEIESGNELKIELDL